MKIIRSSVLLPLINDRLVFLCLLEIVAERVIFPRLRDIHVHEGRIQEYTPEESHKNKSHKSAQTPSIKRHRLGNGIVDICQLLFFDTTENDTNLPIYHTSRVV